VVTLAPRFVLINKTDRKIFYKQKAVSNSAFASLYPLLAHQVRK